LALCYTNGSAPDRGPTGKFQRQQRLYLKTHGALGNMAERESDMAQAIARAARSVDGDLAILCGPLGAQTPAAEATGLRAVAEIFADRGYKDWG
jgi:UPF0271 protein